MVAGTVLLLADVASALHRTGGISGFQRRRRPRSGRWSL
jgi:hypothetical protein